MTVQDLAAVKSPHVALNTISPKNLVKRFTEPGKVRLLYDLRAVPRPRSATRCAFPPQVSSGQPIRAYCLLASHR